MFGGFDALTLVSRVKGGQAAWMIDGGYSKINYNEVHIDIFKISLVLSASKRIVKNA